MRITFPRFLLSLKDLRREALPEGRGTLELQRAQRSCKTDRNILKHQNMSGSDMGDDHKEYFAGEAALKAAGDYEGLQKLPKDASPVRLHNRCKLTGRPKGYMRQFGVSRVTFREMANNGLIPGVRKASW